MALRTIMLSPNGDSGYATFLEMPKDGAPLVNVMTKLYVMRILKLGNTMLYQQLKQLGKDIEPPNDNETDPEQVVKYTHKCFILLGYKDRQPHLAEMVDAFYDFNEAQYEKNPSDPQSAIITINKRYNTHAGGAFLVPSYPELLPVAPPFPFIPFPTFPV